MKKLSKEKITEIIDNSDDCYIAMLNLYKEVISPVRWDNIKSLSPWEVHVNRNTGQFILDKMHEKFTEGDNAWIVNSLVLNKGFSSNHDEIPDWKVKLTNNCYTLINE